MKMYQNWIFYQKYGAPKLYCGYLGKEATNIA